MGKMFKYQQSDSFMILAIGASQAKTLKEPDPRYSCIFCHRVDIDDINLGPMYIHEGIVTHYFCLLFSASLTQAGSDKDGIAGFMVDDILKEVRRGQRLKCIYCHTTTATVGCCVRRCPASFHFPCGLTNNANFQFHKNYESYCKNHSQVLPERLPSLETECQICKCNIAEAEAFIVGSCCKSAIFHKECTQKLAITAGYYFKCPCCNDQKDFPTDMKAKGIFVPQQDAAWEREPNAYQDLLNEYKNCDAEVCECPKGRTYGAAKGSWLLARCRICGAAGTHRHCGKLLTIANWACSPCLEIEFRTEADRKAMTAKEDMHVASSQAAGIDYFVKPIAPISKDFSGRSFSNQSISIRGGRLTSKADKSLQNVTIDRHCQEYFPHNKQALRTFMKHKGSIPDWRTYVLRVNLVNLFPRTEHQRMMAPKSNHTLADKTRIDTSTELMSNRAPKKTRKSSSKRHKRSSWQKGVVAPRNRQKSENSDKSVKSKETLSPPSNDTMPPMPASPLDNHMETAEETTEIDVDVMQPPEPVKKPNTNTASSLAVLAGIQKSTELIQRLSQKANGTANNSSGNGK